MRANWPISALLSVSGPHLAGYALRVYSRREQNRDNPTVFIMPEFSYTARTLAGEHVSGAIVADTRRDALGALFDRSLFPMRVENSENFGAKWQRLFATHRRIKSELIATNLTQLADLLQNGVPLLASLKILSEQSTHPGLAQVLRDVHDRVADGLALDKAMAKHPRVFDELTVSMVRAGTEGSFLEEALQRTADFMQLQQELKSRLTGAMAYPAFLAVTGFVVTMVLVVFFVPKFAALFEHLERAGGLPSAHGGSVGAKRLPAQFMASWSLSAAPDCLSGCGVPHASGRDAC